MKILAIIGARSGSRTIPHKNIQLLNGKPLFAWAVEKARASRHVNRIIVSTDSEEYARIARAYGAETPFLQPPEVSHDRATEVDFISHAVDWLEKNEGYIPDIIVRIFATTPLHRVTDIDRLIELVKNDPHTHSAVIVSEARQHPHKALKIAPSGEYVVAYITETGRDVTPLQRQRYEPAYFRAGAPIVTRLSVLKEHKNLTDEKVRYLIVPQEYAVDIDSPIDFYVVEQLMKKYGSGNEPFLA